MCHLKLRQYNGKFKEAIVSEKMSCRHCTAANGGFFAAFRMSAEHSFLHSLHTYPKIPNQNSRIQGPVHTLYWSAEAVSCHQD